MPVNVSGDDVFDGDCMSSGCEHWGGDGICMMSIDWSIHSYQLNDMKHSFWRHLGWCCSFWRKKYFAEWNLTLWQHLKAKLGLWTPQQPKDCICPYDSEFLDELQEDDYWDPEEEMEFALALDEEINPEIYLPTSAIDDHDHDPQDY